MNYSQPFLDDHVSGFQTLAIRCVLASVLVGELVIVALYAALGGFA